jgi:hypothetical protein
MGQSVSNIDTLNNIKCYDFDLIRPITPITGWINTDFSPILGFSIAETVQGPAATADLA